MGTSRGPAYRVETERLVVRCFQPSDAALLKAAVDASLDALRPWMPWALQEPQTVEAKVAMLRRFRAAFDSDSDFAYGAFDREEREAMGSSGLHPRVGAEAMEIGYWVHAAHHGKGFATEIAGALTRVGFELHGLERIEIRCAPNNARSIAVARKLGYSHDGTLRDRVRDSDGKLRDAMIWSMLAREYSGSAAAQLPVRAFGAAGERLL